MWLVPVPPTGRERVAQIQPPAAPQVDSPLSSPQSSMNLPPDKARLLRQYDNEKKWDLICDQVPGPGAGAGPYPQLWGLRGRKAGGRGLTWDSSSGGCLAGGRGKAGNSAGAGSSRTQESLCAQGWPQKPSGFSRGRLMGAASQSPTHPLQCLLRPHR